MRQRTHTAAYFLMDFHFLSGDFYNNPAAIGAFYVTPPKMGIITTLPV
jgi:hypothetical protein